MTNYEPATGMRNQETRESCSRRVAKEYASGVEGGVPPDDCSARAVGISRADSAADLTLQHSLCAWEGLTWTKGRAKGGSDAEGFVAQVYERVSGGGSLDDAVNALGRGNRSKVGGIESLWWEFASCQDWVATEGVRGWDWRRREI